MHLKTVGEMDSHTADTAHGNVSCNIYPRPYAHSFVHIATHAPYLYLTTLSCIIPSSTSSVSQMNCESIVITENCCTGRKTGLWLKTYFRFYRSKEYFRSGVRKQGTSAQMPGELPCLMPALDFKPIRP